MVVSHTYLGITCQGLGMGTNELAKKSEQLSQRTSASRVWPYMHQLRIMSWVNSWVAWLLCLLPYVPLYRLG